MERIQTIALTPGAATTLQDVPAELQIAPASQLLSAHWARGGNLLVIGAIGAVTRLVAPLAQDKHSDPAVVVMDARGEHVVPLLGGHAAGAEQLARDLAAALGGRAVLTGDASTQGRLALDSLRRGMGLDARRRSQGLASADAITGPGATAEPGPAKRNNALVHQCWQPTAQSSGWIQSIGRLEHRGWH